MAGETDVGAPLVSVLIPSYNRADTIVECVHSALRQTYNNIEVIVVDDGSTDETVALLPEFDGAITIIRQTNSGQSAATRVAMQHATGELIAFLDSDDLWKDDKVAKQVAVLLANPDVAAVHTDAEEFVTLGENHMSYVNLHSRLRSADLMNAMVCTDTPLRSTVMCRRAFLAGKRNRP